MVIMVKLSSHFSFEELSYTSYSFLSAQNRTCALCYKDNLTALAFYVLEPVRALLGTPLKITSAYRCEELNKFVGGVVNSQHLLGQAADFIPEKWDLSCAFCKINSAEYLHFGQIILEQGWIHISLGVLFRPLEKCRQIIKK